MTGLRSCIDCEKPDCWAFMEDGIHVHEDFYVHDSLFEATCPDGGIICIPCFEKRLGRPLTRDDFKGGPYDLSNGKRIGINMTMLTGAHPSALFRDRVGYTGPLPGAEQIQAWWVEFTNARAVQEAAEERAVGA